MAAMMMVMAAAADSLRQILNIGELATLGSIREIRRELIQLRRCRRVAVRRRGLGRILQIRGDLLGDLLVFRGVGLLQLLERAHQLCERRKLAVIRLRLQR